MKKSFLLIALTGITHCLFSQQKAADSAAQYLLIVRYKSNMNTPGADLLKSNSEHWVTYIRELAQKGKLISGFRPAADGRIITGSAKTSINSIYDRGEEVVSSILVIKAANMKEAAALAEKCPIYEINGSVEIRPIINTTN